MSYPFHRCFVYRVLGEEAVEIVNVIHGAQRWPQGNSFPNAPKSDDAATAPRLEPAQAGRTQVPRLIAQKAVDVFPFHDACVDITFARFDTGFNGCS